MRYFADGELPALHALARAFTIFDHWHASVPGPTWPNRLVALSGTSLGRVTMPEGPLNWNLHWYDQTTLFDRLNEKRIGWKVYAGDFPLSMLFVHQLEPVNASRYEKLHQFYIDASGKPDDLPQFSFLEPNYLPPNPNDDHPCHDIMGGQAVVANVYNVLRGNPERWAQTLLFISYDEHGGFYDHVLPPATVPPDGHTDDGFDFKRLGVRVPAVLVSPWVGDAVVSDTLDHTAFLKFLIDWWGLNPLGARAASYQRTLEAAFLAAPNLSAGPTQLSGLPAAAASRPEVLAGNQAAMVSLSQAIETLSTDDPATIAARLRHSTTGAQSQADVAIERTDSFIAGVKDKLGR
jgi:phospholipase C